MKSTNVLCKITWAIKTDIREAAETLNTSDGALVD